MTNEKYTEEFKKALNDYIKLGFNQDECNGFMHGFHKGAEAQQLILPSVVVPKGTLCDLDGKKVMVKFKVTKHMPKIFIEDI